MKNKFYFIGSIAIILLGIISINANAQHVDFGYDASGNRVLRQYSPFRLMNDTSKNDTIADQIASEYGIRVYPNPLMDGNTVTVAILSPNDKTSEEATVYVLDNTGKKLFTQKQITDSASEIDLSAYSAGIYYIKVGIGKELLFYKIIKAK